MRGNTTIKDEALRKGTRCQKAAFLLSIERGYETMIKEEEDPSEDEASNDK
jgi:hypothetical protein